MVNLSSEAGSKEMMHSLRKTVLGGPQTGKH